MKKILLLISILLLSACTTFDPLDFVKANSQVSAFLDDHPDADITVIKLTEGLIGEENTKVNELCGISLETKPHYKVSIVEEDLEMYTYIDIANQEIICLKKIGKESDEDEKSGKEKDNDKEYEKDYDKDDDEKDYSDCNETIKLEGKYINDKIYLEWNEIECEGFQGYKVVRSETDDNLQYPEDGYVKYITNFEENEYSEKIQSETTYFAITVLTTTGKLYSDTIEIVAKNYGEVDEGNDEETEKINGYNMNLEQTMSDDGIKLSWNHYDGDNLKYYKVVWSQKNADPKYPEDGYIEVISDSEKSYYTVPSKKYKEGKNYYRITAVFDGDMKKHSNVIKLEKEPEAPIEYEAILESEELDDGEYMLTWNKYPGSNLKYYKVVWSIDNPNLMYPEDDYIEVTSNEEYKLRADLIDPGMNYYRVTVVLDGFDEDNTKRYNSNVLTIETPEAPINATQES